MNLVTIDGRILLCEAAYDSDRYRSMLRDCVAEAVPESHNFVLVDDASLSIEAVGQRRALPFLEKQGHYNGWPANNEEAIRELERMRTDGAKHIVFARPGFSWLGHYSGLRQYLCTRFPCRAYRTDPGHAVCLIFDMRRASNDTASSEWRRVSAADIWYAQSLVPEQSLKRSFAQAVQQLVAESGSDVIGDYLEFGVYVGTSLACMYSVLEEWGLDQVRLIGFDSFEGLPEETSLEDVDWKAGEFSCNLATTQQFLSERGIDRNRISLVDGWFRDTLKPGLAETYRITKAGIVMVDCDIYASTVDVLRFCAPLVKDQAIFFFDDWHSSDLATRNLGQKRAFDDFISANNMLDISEFGSYADNAAAFHIKRRA